MKYNKPQGPPKSGHIEVTPEVIADLCARSTMGRAKYGTVLRTMNGRSALTDLYQEILDASCYLKQILIETTQDIPEMVEENRGLRERWKKLRKLVENDIKHTSPFTQPSVSKSLQRVLSIMDELEDG